MNIYLKDEVSGYPLRMTEKRISKDPPIEYGYKSWDEWSFIESVGNEVDDYRLTMEKAVGRKGESNG